MDNKTYWALRRRESASSRSRTARKARAEDRPTVIPNVENSSTGEGLSYRDLQAKAKELDIPANQSAEALAEAIEEAGE